MTRSVVVDGSVLCGVDAGRKFDYGRLRVAMQNIREECGPNLASLKVFVDASLRYKFDASDKRDLEEDLGTGAVEQTPAGLPADVFILRWAETHGAIVITNDLYREWTKDFPWISDNGSGRFVSGVYDQQLKKWTFLERYFLGSPRNLESLVMVDSTIEHSPEKFSDPTRDKFTQPITRSLPTAVVFLIDQSGSMLETWTNEKSKSEVVASFVNDTIYELILTCTRQDGVRPYIDVAIIGYGGDRGSDIRSEIPSTDLLNPFQSVTKMVDFAEFGQSSDSHSTMVQPVWVKPKARGGTPMNLAINTAGNILKQWVATHPNSFPPIVFNITDGESTDGDPSDSAAELTNMSTSDGNVLLFTAHISTRSAEALQYPEFLDENMSPLIRRMFTMSSHVPNSMRLLAGEMGIEMRPASRGFLFNASANDVIGMLNVGSPATRVRDQQL